MRDDECWAIIGPTTDTGGQVRQALVDVVRGHKRPRLADRDGWHAPVHSLKDGVAPEEAIAYVPFETRPRTSGEFVDYAARYGSIREDDRETLLESLLASQGVYTGLVARRHMRPDPLAEHESTTGLLKWKNDGVKQEAERHAREVKERIEGKAPILGLTGLLSRPLISLSNGQMRRARILRALIQGAQWAVLDDPLKGLDTPSRNEVSRLLGELHARGAPRLCLVLREQDPVPACISHILRIDEDGRITQLGSKEQVPEAAAPKYPPGGYEVVKRNAREHVHTGLDEPPVVAMNHVTIRYGDATVLDDVSLSLSPGARVILVGDNGSGKTTLLSLILGDHPHSFAMSKDTFSLWGGARDAPQNAHVLLQRRVGHLSPELFQAFPRKSLEAGGLTVSDAIASGFDGIFTFRRRTAEQMQRVDSLINLFADVIAPDQPVSELPFAALPHGAQAVVLFLRALVHRPGLLVVDEPFQGMGADQVAKTREYLDGADWALAGIPENERLAELAWRERLVLVAVSHYEQEWPRSCGRLVRLAHGRIVESF